MAVSGTATALAAAVLTDFRGVYSALRKTVEPTVHLAPRNRWRPWLGTVVWLRPNAWIMVVVAPMVFIAGLVITIAHLA